MSEAEKIFKILPIKPDFDLKQVHKAKNKILLRYHPDCIDHVKPEQLKRKLHDKYNEITSIINSTIIIIKNNPTIYNSDSDYKQYIKTFKINYLNTLSNDELKIILKANGLKTIGTVKQLKNRIIDNVPERFKDYT